MLERGAARGATRDARLLAAINGRRVMGAFRAPGRVNLIGEHVDYCGGPVVPTNVDLDTTVVAVAGEQLVLRALDLDSTFTLGLDPSAWEHFASDPTRPTWQRLAAALAGNLHQGGTRIGAAELLIAGTVPVGAGLSSSSALAVALAVTWRGLAGQAWSTFDLAESCSAAEIRGFGVAGGLMDQVCSLACGKGEAILFDARGRTLQPVPLPVELGVLVVDSGVRRALATSPYNERRADCERALVALRNLDPSLPDLAAATPEMLASVQLDEQAARRARHVVTEVVRVHAMVAALSDDDTAAIGGLLAAGHRSLARDFDVSTPELDTLVAQASTTDGVVGARLTGAGFGGCAVVLVDAGREADVAAAVVPRYRMATGREATVWAIGPTAPAGPRDAPG